MTLRGEEVEVEFKLAPADPEVGIMNSYAEEWQILGHEDWELTEKEVEELDKAVNNWETGQEY